MADFFFWFFTWPPSSLLPPHRLSQNFKFIAFRKIVGMNVNTRLTSNSHTLRSVLKICPDSLDGTLCPILLHLLYCSLYIFVSYIHISRKSRVDSKNAKKDEHGRATKIWMDKMKAATKFSQWVKFWFVLFFFRFLFWLCQHHPVASSQPPAPLPQRTASLSFVWPPESCLTDDDAFSRWCSYCFRVTIQLMVLQYKIPNPMPPNRTERIHFT